MKNVLRLFVFSFLIFSSYLQGDVLSSAGKGFLESIDGQIVIHLKGSPYEIGFQHGSLLKEQIHHNLSRFVDPLFSEKAPQVSRHFIKNLPLILPYLTASQIAEMQGVADAAGVSYERILLLNLFPEMFHCTGITAMGEATENRILYHVRVLDYAVGASLQDTAVLAVVEPDAKKAFLNVTYAGFIGMVTGMNAEGISIGEIGGGGYGSWNGVTMAFLLRQIAEEASSLDEIKQILEKTPRTCEYYYVFADGKTGQSFGVYATAQELKYLHPNESNSIQKWVHKQPKDCLLISREKKYDLLFDRIQQSYGKINAVTLQEIIKQPVSMKSNLHNAIFSPANLDVWISHAGPSNEPACDQPYYHFNLKNLLDYKVVH